MYIVEVRFGEENDIPSESKPQSQQREKLEMDPSFSAPGACSQPRATLPGGAGLPGLSHPLT